MGTRAHKKYTVSIMGTFIIFLIFKYGKKYVKYQVSSIHFTLSIINGVNVAKKVYDYGVNLKKIAIFP